MTAARLHRLAVRLLDQLEAGSADLEPDADLEPADDDEAPAHLPAVHMATRHLTRGLAT